MIANTLLIDNMSLIMTFAYIRILIEILCYHQTGEGLGALMGNKLHQSKRALHNMGLILAVGVVFFFHFI